MGVESERLPTTGRQPVLIGEYDLTLDEKGRLLIPADIRRSIPPELGEAFYVLLGVNGVPWLWVEQTYEQMVMQLPTDMIPGDDSLAFDQIVFGLTSKVAWDKQGRALMPSRVLERGSIGREVTLVGVRDHLELWDRQAWIARREELERKRGEVFERARHARQVQTTRPAAAT